VLTSAEEAADPWAADPALADELDALARERGVSVLGAGLNPGFAFDALVLTAAGACVGVRALRVERVVDLSGFGPAVLARLGVGHAPDAFAAGVAAGTITGHLGFPQSMRVVARALGVAIERIDRTIDPLLRAGVTAGFEQRYTAVAGGRPWFEARFTGHVDPAAAGLATRDVIELDATPPVRMEISGGLPSQAGSAAVLANSVARVAAAPPGWVTVAGLPPALPVV
jgi:4-hydroxy-tetrahydrodipicolinate reductase